MHGKSRMLIQPPTSAPVLAIRIRCPSPLIWRRVGQVVLDSLHQYRGPDWGRAEIDARFSQSIMDYRAAIPPIKTVAPWMFVQLVEVVADYPILHQRRRDSDSINHVIRLPLVRIWNDSTRNGNVQRHRNTVPLWIESPRGVVLDGYPDVSLNIRKMATVEAYDYV